MKTVSSTRIVLGLLLGLGFAESSPGQAVILFANQGSGINAPFYDASGTNRLSGNRYLAALFVGMAAAGEGAMVQLAPPQPFREAPFAGYWVSSQIPVPFKPGTAIDAQVRCWDTEEGRWSSFGAALAGGAPVGISKVLRLVVNPTGPTTLAGLTSVRLVSTSPPLDRSHPFEWTDVMALPNGAPLQEICGLPVAQSGSQLVRFSVGGTATLENRAPIPETIMAVLRRCPDLPTGCEVVACQNGAPARSISFPVEPGSVYAVVYGRPSGGSGPVTLRVSLETVLGIRPLAQQRIELAWPYDATNHILESTVEAHPLAEWISETNAVPSIESGRWIVVVPSSSSRRVFRLRLPFLP